MTHHGEKYFAVKMHFSLDKEFKIIILVLHMMKILEQREEKKYVEQFERVARDT
jgi:hypothetical protein